MRATLLISPLTPEIVSIVERLGKPYIWTPVPKGLPRYRTPGACHANSQKAVFYDDRLRYVEGIAASGINGIYYWHAWVTLDGVHAIDLTLRGQSVRWSKRNLEVQRLNGTTAQFAEVMMQPATEYYGVEIPTVDIARLVSENNAHGFYLEEWAARHKAAS
jgi:hypothetical protein